MSGYDLNLCRCGGQANIIVKHPTHFGPVGAFVQCQTCRATGSLMGISRALTVHGALITDVDDMSITKGIKEAIIDWNRRNP